MLHGWRARIGFIYPSSGRRDYELTGLLPHGVTGHFTRVAFSGEGSLDAIGAMSQDERLAEAAGLLAPVGLDSITWADTSGSFMFGVAGARRQAAEVGAAGGAFGSSTSIALLEACKRLGISSLAVASPYTAEVNDALARFLAEAGIGLARLEALELGRESEISRLAPETMRRLARRAGQDGDALFIPCTDVPALELVPELEEDLGKPVLTAIQITVWHALRLAGVESGVDAAGALLHAAGT